MKILLLNQTFYPDVMATGQLLSELAAHLAQRGHEVTVVTGRRAYDDPNKIFHKKELWRHVRIYRVLSTGFGKRAKWRRAVDFASFIVGCCFRLLLLPRHDVVLALTTPPLISFIGACVARKWRSRFYYWVMDFNPDEAIAAGWLRADSLSGRMLDWMSRFSLRRADGIIALDSFMRERIVVKNISPEKIAVIPPWMHDGEVRFDPPGRKQFRSERRLDDKFVVMYSGNHSPCHPLDTLLEAALLLKNDGGIAFCFVGGGSEFEKVKRFSANHALSNITSLPYQPLDQLGASLSAADLHVVVMGNPFVGLVHPCKIYNILGVGSPVLYIGPEPSHITELLARLGNSWPRAQARHGDVEAVVAGIQKIREMNFSIDRPTLKEIPGELSSEALLPKIISLLETKS